MKLTSKRQIESIFRQATSYKDPEDQGKSSFLLIINMASSARMPLSNQKRPSTSKKATRPDFYLQVGQFTKYSTKRMRVRRT